MREDRIGQSIRALRHRRGWRQIDLAARCGVSDSVISDLERGRLAEVSLPTVRRVIEALDARLVLDIWWRSGELNRLLDADHARLSEIWQRRLLATAAGWMSRSEVSFNHYGERGIIDNVAYRALTRTVAVTEIKSAIYDHQDLLGKLDIKERVAREVARRFGWNADRVVPCLVVADGRTNRRRIEEHPGMYSRFDMRGRRALGWLRDPRPAAGGLLVFAPLPNSAHSGARRAGRQRVRRIRGDSSVVDAPDQPASVPLTA
jgi:transcriptional regulator with XRE-family HTH domain